jgi:GTP cyclohydrolase I
VQERLTAEICRLVSETLAAKGVIVVCNANHLCMQMRGLEKLLAATDTIDYLGEFASNAALRQEFFSLLANRR